MLKALLLFLSLNSLSLAQVQELDLEDLDDAAILEAELEGNPDEVLSEEEIDLDDLDSLEAEVGGEISDEYSAEEQALIDDLELLEKGQKEIKQEQQRRAELIEQEKEEGIKQQALNQTETVLPAEERAEFDIEDPSQINFEVVEEISEARKNNINTIINQKARRRDRKLRYTNPQLEALKVQLSDISRSPIRLIYIPRGTQLIRVNDNKTFYTTKAIYAKAHTQLDFSKLRYIINKQDELAYAVVYNKVSNIDKDVDLYRKPHFFKRLKPRKKVKNLDEEIDYYVNFNFHFGFANPEFTRNLVNDTDSFAPNLRIELATLSKLNFDYQFGLTGTYENTTGRVGTEGNYNITSLSIGPVFKSRKIWEHYRLVLQGRLSFFSQIQIGLQGDSQRYGLSENSLQVGLETQTPLGKFGHFTYGYNFQRKWINASAAGDTAVNTNPRTRYDDSLSIYIGHRSDWIW